MTELLSLYTYVLAPCLNDIWNEKNLVTEVVEKSHVKTVHLHMYPLALI